MMNRAVIMTGFHFPPSALSSGHLRLLGFAKYLPESGWDPVVLSATRCAYERIDPASTRSIPETCRVYRAIAMDAKRHLGIFGKYPSLLERPDRWASWWPAAVWLGLRLIKRYRAQAIWSTYPIMTAHCVAYTLSRLTDLPWIADFRDPVASSVSPDNRFAVASQRRWEQKVMRDAERITFTTPSALRDYATRYPDAYRAGRLTVIQNGYDEAAFTDLQQPSSRQSAKPLVLVHSGALYPDGRDPFPFFAALAKLKSAGMAGPDEFKVVLRASSCEARYQHEIDRLGITELVTLAPPVGNHEALIEQASADGLLVFQGSQFDRQIPAKLYEYLRIGRPIFALVGESGDTAALLQEAGGAVVVPLNDVSAIARGLARFVQSLVREPRDQPRVLRPDVAKWSRRQRTVELAELLGRVAE